MSFQPMNTTKNNLQIFIQQPNLYILKKVLECFEISDINNQKIISKIHTDIKSLNQKMTNIIPDLSLYYQPRLINNYFYENNITFIKCISILRHMVYQFDFLLLKMDMVINKKKIVYYKIANKTEFYQNHKKIHINRSKSTLCSFD